MRPTIRRPHQEKRRAYRYDSTPIAAINPQVSAGKHRYDDSENELDRQEPEKYRYCQM